MEKKVPDKKSDDEDSILEGLLSTKYSISSVESKQKAHVLQLDSVICPSASEYFELIKFLYTVEKTDRVTLLLGGYGGCENSGTQLAHAIRNCPAGVDIIVHSNCYSMHSIIALCGRSLIMQPKTILMFHNYSSQNRGKGAELYMAIEEQSKNALENDMHFCYPFLTRAEIKKISRDQDVYIHESDKDLKERITRHF